LVQASGQELDAKLAASRAHGYDLGVIDIAPHSSADARASASRSDRVGIRTQPPIRALDAIGATAELMAGLGAEAEILLNRNSPPNRIGEARIAQEARQALRVYATPVVAAISRRVACRHALIDGRSVIEFNRSGNTAAEIDRLWQGLRKELQR
jgi:cellulose biosynthesis protein BcsQ